MAEHVQDQAEFLDTKLKPQLDAAQAGQGHVFFVDAAHFVFGTFLCCLWSFTRIFVRAASGRQRFNVLGAWNAVTRELIAVTNTTVVNTETMCELLRKIADLGLTGPITLVLDNARYQRNAVVQAWAAQLGITLLFLPSYSPNLNLIERLWKFTKRRALYGRYHPTFRDFQAAIQEVLDGLSTKYSQQLASLMTLNFQQFDDVSRMPVAGVEEPGQPAVVEAVDLVQVGDLVDGAQIKRGGQGTADGSRRGWAAGTAGGIARRGIQGHCGLILTTSEPGRFRNACDESGQPGPACR